MIQNTNSQLSGYDLDSRHDDSKLIICSSLPRPSSCVGAYAMATPTTRARALALYRSLLRCGRRWPGSADEQTYILDESKTCFRKHRTLSNPEEITKKLDDGEVRLQLGWHYKIPYPRLHNLPSGTVAEKPKSVTLPVYEVPSQYTT